MFEREVTLSEFMWGYLRLLANDMDDATLNNAPFAGANPPVWILGHLAVSTDYACRMLGPDKLPAALAQDVRAGSNPAALEPPLPTKAELLGALEAGFNRIKEAAPKASAEMLNQPHSVEILRRTNLKTNGDVIAHLMCTHPAFHVAQLSACRRQAGKGPIV